MLEWFKDQDGSVKKLLDSSPINCMLTSPKIQKQLCEACAQETKNAMLAKIGDKKICYNC